MRYDFDRTIDRMGTYSTQWDYAADRFGSADVLPFSISDTDFAVPDEVMDALRVRMEPLIINFIRTLPTFIRTCTDECGNPIP